MAESIAATIHELANSLLERSRDGVDDLALQLSEALGQLLFPDFCIGFVGVKGEAGEVLIERALLIYTTSQAEQLVSEAYVPSNAVAGVMHVAQTLNEDSLAEGYSLIGKIKALPGHDTDSANGWHHVPVGMIVALDCERPLEKLVDGIAILNRSVPSTTWPDGVTILARGFINYAVQFEGGHVSDFARFVTDRIICFVEEVCVHGMQRCLPASTSITETPLAERPTERPERFRLCTAGGGMLLWEILYHDAAFDEM